jgi:hypothetical protein
MEGKRTQFAHVLLFACPVCARPLATACNSTKRNLEAADGQYFRPHCLCGWSGEVIGMKAIKHSVEPWSDAAPVGTDVPGSCDGETVAAGFA